MKLGQFQYKKAESTLVYNDSSFRWSGIAFYIYALLRSKSGENLPGKGTKYCKRVKQIPAEIAKDLSGEMKVKAEEALAAKELWFIRVEGEGWEWLKRGGQKSVPFIQELLLWLEGFRESSKAHSSQAFYIEVVANPIH